MPIEIISGKDALRSRHGTSRWPDPKKDPDRYIPYPRVEHTPAFKIAPEDHIFTIGSCFARNTERALVRMGLPVLSALVEGVSPEENITNKYTTRSIAHDLRTAFSDEGDQFSTIYGDESRGFYNLTFGGTGALSAAPRVQVEDLTKRYFDNLNKLRMADVVIITLGLVEVWRDRETGNFLNISPNPILLRSSADRFEVQILSFEDIVSDLREILKSIRTVARPGVRFLLTVSPVPLHATFRAQDVIQANAYSKGVQRAAAEVICAEHSDVSYFPSYEIVTMTAPKLAWSDRDFRHVKHDLVERIMRQVIESYVGDDAITPSKETLRALTLAGKANEVISKIEAHLKARGLSVPDLPDHAQWYYAGALAKCGRQGEARPILEPFVIRNPSHGPASQLLRALSGTKNTVPAQRVKSGIWETLLMKVKRAYHLRLRLRLRRN